MLFGTQSSSAENYFIYDQGNFQMDLQILPGSYEFYLIANEDEVWNLQDISDKDAFVISNYTNPIKSINELNLSNGIPMVGMASFNIPNNTNSTETDPFLMQPIINLKRTLAKV